MESLLQPFPARFAYYPGAQDRFAKATGKPAPESNDGTLPWTLIRDANIAEQPHLFQEESFTCVCAETSLSFDSPIQFLHGAVDFVNDQMFGHSVPRSQFRLELNPSTEKNWIRRLRNFGMARLALINLSA